MPRLEVQTTETTSNVCGWEELVFADTQRLRGTQAQFRHPRTHAYGCRCDRSDKHQMGALASQLCRSVGPQLARPWTQTIKDLFPIPHYFFPYLVATMPCGREKRPFSSSATTSFVFLGDQHLGDQHSPLNRAPCPLTVFERQPPNQQPTLHPQRGRRRRSAGHQLCTITLHTSSCPAGVILYSNMQEYVPHFRSPRVSIAADCRVLGDALKLVFRHRTRLFFPHSSIPFPPACPGRVRRKWGSETPGRVGSGLSMDIG